MPKEQDLAVLQKWIVAKVRGQVKNGLVVDRLKRFLSGEIKELRIPMEVVLNDDTRKIVERPPAHVLDEKL